MSDLFRTSTTSQMLAALKTVRACVEQCPDNLWHEPIVRLRYCQAAFHVLFFTDVYLGRDLAGLYEQEFHRRHPDLFGVYEELEDQAPTQLYEKSQIVDYIEHCIAKTEAVIPNESDDVLNSRPGFDWLSFSRAEVHLYNLRHVQHHAAQLSMRLNLETGTGAEWVYSGDGSR